MGMQLQYWAEEILRHIPMVTSVGAAMALTLGIIWFTKRSNACAVLALACVMYGATPFLPSWF